MGNKLLLADDSITIQKVVGIIFANEDYELSIVDNGSTALVKAAEIQPDVMLLDAIMPGKSGYEVSEAVRRDPLLKNTPILLLTGAFEPFDEAQARQSGVDDFISKPFESQHLIEKVKTLIQLGKDRAQAAPAAAAPAPAPIIEAPAAPAEDLWAPAQEDATIVFTAPPAAPAPTEEFSFAEEEPAADDIFATEMVTEPAAAEDDLWGAFELEEVTEEDDGEFGTITEVEELSSAAPVETLEEFSFAEEEPPAASPPMPRVGSQWEPVGEQAYSFEDESPTVDPFAEAEQLATPGALEFETTLEEPSSFDLTSFESLNDDFVAPTAAEPPPLMPPPVSAAPATPSVAAPAASPAPPVAPAAPAAQAPPAAAAIPAAPAGEVTLSEDQLASLVARISRDIIERIAWEVVPDLAEALIKEEIRKIKEGN